MEYVVLLEQFSIHNGRIESDLFSGSSPLSSSLSFPSCAPARFLPRFCPKTNLDTGRRNVNRACQK
jgi:hypothetical protein